MRAAVKLWVVGAALLTAGVAGAQPAPPKAPNKAELNAASGAKDLPGLAGYLGKNGVPDPIAILPPPPTRGSPDDLRDAAVYKSTRTLAGTPRWAMAATDSVRYIQAFDCPLGLKLEDGPKAVLTVLARAGRDAGAMSSTAKDHYKVARPFVGKTDAVCVEKDRSGLTGSPSYPSGHSTFSWTAGLILAELAPGQASEILARARAFGESRVVCGVHTVSDIEAGRTEAAALVAALHADPAFRADMDAARAALRSAMTAAHDRPDAGQCRIEADAEMHTPWINPTTDK